MKLRLLFSMVFSDDDQAIKMVATNLKAFQQMFAGLKVSSSLELWLIISSCYFVVDLSASHDV